MPLTLTKLSETATKITLGWTPVSGAIGYRFQSSVSAPKWSHTWDPSRSQVSFSQAAWYKVEALGVEAAGEYPVPEPPPPPPPPPPTGALPGTITAGGTYSGSRTGTVQVRTTEPVVIENAVITHSGDAPLLDLFHAGAQVTVRKTTFNGALGRVGKAIHGSGTKSLLVDHCTLNYTWGIRIDSVQAGGASRVLSCKATNMQGVRADMCHFFQSANNGGTQFTYECAWNQVIGEFGKTQVEDIVSIHSTTGPGPHSIHDNYFAGSWPWYPTMTHGSSHSGSGIMVEGASNVDVYGNLVVACTNCGIGIASGGNNKVHDNRCVSSGRTPDGTELAFANVGIYGYAGSGGNQVFDNVIGWMGSPGSNPLMRNDMYLPYDGNTWYARNQSLKAGTVTYADELAEWDRWQAKLAAAGVVVGA